MNVRQWVGLAVTVLVGTLVPATQRARATSCHFTVRPVQVGDTAVQNVDIEMNLLVTFRQNGQTIHTTNRGTLQTQRRAVTVLRVQRDHATQARIVFITSAQSATTGSGPAKQIQQPVAGKTYLASRTDRGALAITDLKGNPPPAAEMAIVARAMEALGRPNPLAAFFGGRTIDQGQTVSLPTDLANDAIGFRQAVGRVTRFAMTLRTTRILAGRTCAVFDTQIHANSPLGDGRPWAMTGQLILEADTCRIVAIQVACPLAISETRGPKGNSFVVCGRGTLQVSMRSRHGHRGPSPTAVKQCTTSSKDGSFGKNVTP